MSNDILLTTVYRRAAVSFLILTVGLLLLVAFAVLPKALIVITPERIEYEDTIPVSITPEPVNADEIEGVSFTTTITLEQTFSTTGEQEVLEELTGTVTIVNNYSREQALVRTTRLLTADGVLLRLDKAVTVPAGGSIEAPVYLDPEVPAVGSIPPGKLTIPGLWEGLQEYIYATIDTPLQGKGSVERVVLTDDITFAQNTLRAKGITEAESLLTEQLRSSQEIENENRNNWALLLVSLEDEMWPDANSLINSVTETFRLQGTLTIRGIFFDEEAAKSLVIERLAPRVNATITVRDLAYEFVEQSENTSRIIIAYTGEGDPLTKETIASELKVGGLSGEEATQVLLTDSRIKNVSIELSPFWVTKVPKHKIDIVILPYE